MIGQLGTKTYNYSPMQMSGEKFIRRRLRLGLGHRQQQHRSYKSSTHARTHRRENTPQSTQTGIKTLNTRIFTQMVGTKPHPASQSFPLVSQYKYRVLRSRKVEIFPYFSALIINFVCIVSLLPGAKEGGELFSVCEC